MNNYIKVSFAVTPAEETASDVLAALLAEVGFESFVTEEWGMTAYAPTVTFDKEAMAIYNEEPEEMAAPMNPKGKFINYYYSYDCSYFLDTAEPSITFIISDYSPYRGVEPDDWATSTNKYYTMSNETIGEMVAISTTTVTFEQVKVNGIFVKI
jgi:hypothetical protein